VNLELVFLCEDGETGYGEQSGWVHIMAFTALDAVGHIFS